MIQPGPYKNTLIVQLGDIGDVVFCTPLIKALKLALPNSRLSFLTESSAASLLSTNPYLDDLLIWDRGQYRDWPYVISRLIEMRRKRFDLIIDLQGSPRTALVAWLSGATCRLGFDYRLRKRLYNQVVKRSNLAMYGVSFKMALLEPLGISGQDLSPRLWTTGSLREWREVFFQNAEIDSSRPVIAISAVSRRVYKRWPLEHFAQLCDALQEKHRAQLLLLWGPGERRVADEVAQLTRAETMISEETPSLLHLAAVLEGCDLLVSNDNGIKHIATAAGIPTFTIYGHSDPISWTFPDPARHGYIRTDCTCGKARKNESIVARCLTSLPAEQVLKGLEPILRVATSTRREDRVGTNSGSVQSDS